MHETAFDEAHRFHVHLCETCPIINLFKNPQQIRAEIRHTRSVASAESVESGVAQAEQAIS